MKCQPHQPCYQFGGKLNMMSPRMNNDFSSAGLAIPESSSAGMRRRTVGEALERLALIQPRPTTGLPYGVQRLLRKPMGVYTAAWFLAAAFVIVDPFDRLEGGLID